MAEEVIIKLELEKGESEKEVDNLTKKITNLTAANRSLADQNKELIKAGKENSAQYIENTRQIEINKQKISEATSSRKNLVNTIIAEDDSIKGLRARNAELIKQRDQLSTSTAEGRSKIAEINDELDKNNETIVKNSSSLEKQKFNIGNYKSALDGLVPGLSGFVDGIQGATKAALQFIATPLGLVLAAIGVAIASVMKYFERTEEGGDKLNKVIFTMEALLGKLYDAMAGLGKVIVGLFESPKQAILDFVDFLKTNLINRIVGMVELFPKLAESIKQAFSGDFEGSLKTLGDAVGKVALGVENVTDKITGLVKSVAAEVTAAVDLAIKQGERMSELDKLLGDQEEDLTVRRAQNALEVARIRESAIKKVSDASSQALEDEIADLEERKKIIAQAVALETELSNKEVEFAKTKLEIAKLQQEIDGVTGETKLAVAQAEAELINQQATRYQNTLRFQKEIAGIEAEAAKKREEIIKRESEAEKNLREERLNQQILYADSIEERVKKEIELEQLKTNALLDNDQLRESERQAIAEQSQNRINEIIDQGNQDQIESDLRVTENRITTNQLASDQVIAARQREIDKAMEAAEEDNTLSNARRDAIEAQLVLDLDAINRRVQGEIELEQAKSIALLANEKLTEDERQAIVQESQNNINAIYSKAQDERYKKDLDANKKLNAEKKRLQQQEIEGLFAVANAAIGFATEVFGQTKAVMIAQAIINTISGITRAFADYAFPYSLIVAALTGAAGFAQVNRIANTNPAEKGMLLARGGFLKRMFHRGGMARGPLHRDGGIPGVVGPERRPVEFEGGEAIINRKSTAMFREQLSAINQAGGGVAFAGGGVTGTQSRANSAQAEARTSSQNIIRNVMENMPPIIVTVEDINARTQEYDSNAQQAQVI